MIQWYFFQLTSFVLHFLHWVHKGLIQCFPTTKLLLDSVSVPSFSNEADICKLLGHQQHAVGMDCWFCAHSGVSEEVGLNFWKYCLNILKVFLSPSALVYSFCCCLLSEVGWRASESPFSVFHPYIHLVFVISFYERMFGISIFYLCVHKCTSWTCILVVHNLQYSVINKTIQLYSFF